jgi:hypothetical protein
MMLAVFVVAVLAYVAASYAVFEVPATLDEGAACGFTSTDFSPSGELHYDRKEAWQISFVRKQEYFAAASIGVALAFVAFALSMVRRLGAVASGAAMGGGMLAFGAVCLSCLAPVLSVMGVVVTGGFLLDLPKWMMALDTLLFAGWGTLFLARRQGACALVPRAARSVDAADSSNGRCHHA